MEAMDVFKFNKSYIDRISETRELLGAQGETVPASQIQTEWSCYAEIVMEAAGWRALWKIPRIACEQLKVPYPTVVVGCVEQINFAALMATFVVEAVQDVEVRLPEKCQAMLQNLWPTVMQTDANLNIDRTANFIDQLRFFFTHIWMPWDDDLAENDEATWVDKHLERRILLLHDLDKKNMSHALFVHMRKLYSEAQYIQQRRLVLEDIIAEQDAENAQQNEVAMLDKSLTNDTELMRLNLRMSAIRNEWILLEDAELRAKHWLAAAEAKPKLQSNIYLIVLPAMLDEITNWLVNMRQLLPNPKSEVHISGSLEHVLSKCEAQDQVFLAPGKHLISYLDCLNDFGNLTGLIASKANAVNCASISSRDDDSSLFQFEKDFIMENLVLNCANVRTGIVLRKGVLHLKKCSLVGDGRSSTSVAIIVCNGAKLDMENCTIDAFATGIVVNEGGTLTVSRSDINNCNIGVELAGLQTKAAFYNATFKKASKCALYLGVLDLGANEKKNIQLNKLKDLENYSLAHEQWIGENFKFLDCPIKFLALNNDQLLLNDYVVQDIIKEDQYTFTEQHSKDDNAVLGVQMLEDDDDDDDKE